LAPFAADLSYTTVFRTKSTNPDVVNLLQTFPFAVADPGGVQGVWTPALLIRVPFLKKIYVQNMALMILPTPPLFEAPYLPNHCEYLLKPYIARNYIHRATFAPLTVWVYLHSFSCCSFPKTRNHLLTTAVIMSINIHGNA